MLKSRGSAARLSTSLSSASDMSISSVFEDGAVTTPTVEDGELHNLEDSDAEEVEPHFLPTVSGGVTLAPCVRGLHTI